MTNWHILGVGAIGSLWACYLEKSGHQVELLFKNRQVLEQYQSLGGLTLVHGSRAETLVVEGSDATAGGTDINNLLITTKAHQTTAALEACGHRIGEQCRFLLLQNGMGIAERISELYSGRVLFCGVTTDGAFCPEPFTVVHAGTGRTDIGAFRHPGDPREVLDLLSSTGMDIHPCQDIEARQWQKLALNCAINGLTVIYHCRNGDLLKHNQAKQRIAVLCDEIKQVGARLGHGAWMADLYEKTENVLRATAANYNSMYQDVEHCRRTEIDYLNGYLLQQAKKLGIACPENQKLYDEIKQKEKELGCR